MQCMWIIVSVHDYSLYIYIYIYILTNAASLKLHQEKRPLSMKSDTIKKRQRYEGQKGKKKKKKKKDKLKKKKKRQKRDILMEEANRGKVAYSPTPPASSIPASPHSGLQQPSSIMTSTTQLMLNLQQATMATQNASFPHHYPHHDPSSPFYNQPPFTFSPTTNGGTPSSDTGATMCDGSCIAGMGAADY